MSGLSEEQYDCRIVVPQALYDRAVVQYGAEWAEANLRLLGSVEPITNRPYADLANRAALAYLTARDQRLMNLLSGTAEHPQESRNR